MNKSYILTGDQEMKVRAEIAEMQRRLQQAESNYDYLLGHLKYKRPCLILPKITGAGCPLQKKKQSLQPKLNLYRLVTYDSDDEGTKEHDYCNPRHFIGFTRSEVMDSVKRYFLSRDSEFVVAAEISFPKEDEPKKPLHIKLELTESELIRAYDHVTHYGYLLDPDFRMDTISPASVEVLETEEFDETLFNTVAPVGDIRDIADEMLHSNDFHDILLPESDVPVSGLPMEDIHDHVLSEVSERDGAIEELVVGGRKMDVFPGDDHTSPGNATLDSKQITQEEFFQLDDDNASVQDIYLDDDGDNGSLVHHSSSSLQNVGASDSIASYSAKTAQPRSSTPHPRSSTPQNVGRNDSSDVQEVIEIEEELQELEEECEDSIHSGCIVAAGDSEGEFIGDADTYSRDADTASRISDSSLPSFNTDRDSGSEMSFSRPSSVRGYESDVASTCTSGISLLDIDPTVDPSLGETYGHYSGMPVKFTWNYRVDLARSGCHRPLRNAIHIGPEGAYSLLLNNAYDAKDHGDSLLVTGEATYWSPPPKTKRSRRRSTFNKRRKKSHKKCDQTMTGGNLALYHSMIYEHPIRVVRSHAMKSGFSPESGYQYGGLFYVYSVHSVRSYEKIKEFKFVLIAEPDLFASREAPRLWQLDAKLLPLAPMHLDFGHPRDSIVGNECHVSPAQSATLGTTKRRSRRIASDSEGETHPVRQTRSVPSESMRETRSGRRSRMASPESVDKVKPERMGETHLLRSLRNSTTALVAKGSSEKSLKIPATVKTAESVEVHSRKRTRTTADMELSTSEGPSGKRVLDSRKMDQPFTYDSRIRTRSRSRSREGKASWLEKVEKWKTGLCTNPSDQLEQYLTRSSSRRRKTNEDIARRHK